MPPDRMFLFPSRSTAMAKRTPLYESHLASGAKMVDFAGWDMPIHYGSQLDEHHTVRRNAGMFDVSHMRAVDVEGPGATAYLRHLLANDVARLKTPGKALYSCMLNEGGGVVDDLIVYRFADDRYRVVVNAGTADKDLAWMASHRAGFDVTVKDRPELAMIAVQGPEARARAWQAFPNLRAGSEALTVFQGAEIGEWLVARTGYTGEDGFEITLPTKDAASAWTAFKAAGIAPCGLGARDTLRLEAGMNLYGQDMDENVGPLESGLAWTVALGDESRDFIGRKALTAQPPARQMVGLVLLDKGVLRAHQAVHTAKGDGETTSGSFAPSLNQSIAMARVPVGVQAGDSVTVSIRDRQLSARVVKPPFVRHGKSLL